MTGRVRVLVVDDSAAMRAALSRILAADPDIDVIGAACEPHEARAMIKALDPDVVTLDIEMPGMDGLAFLEKIMRLRPMPVVMCSTLTARGAEATIAALRLGAVDCVAKPSGSARDIAAIGRQLCATVKAAARANVRALSAPLPPVAALRGGATDMVIAIGASTGGVEALFTILEPLPADCPPVLVVQHMPQAYTAGFAARLDKACRVRVVEASDAMVLAPGTVHVAPGGPCHMVLAPHGPPRIALRAGDPVNGHRPSVDMLFASLARLGRQAVGAILTGMGNDGAQGLLAMRAAGARTFGQDAASCVVHGMPRAALLLGAVETELPLTALPRALIAACRRPPVHA